MSKAGPIKKWSYWCSFTLLKRLLKYSLFWFLFLISEIFWSTFCWEILSPAARRVTPQGRCRDGKAKCYVATRGKVWETSLWAPREGGGGEGEGDPGPWAVVTLQPLERPWVGRYPHHTHAGAGENEKGKEWQREAVMEWPQPPFPILPTPLTVRQAEESVMKEWRWGWEKMVEEF